MKSKYYLFMVVLVSLALNGCKLTSSGGGSAVKESDFASCDSIKTQITALEKRLVDVKSRQGQGCTDAKGTINASGTCVCKDGTPVFKIRVKTCDEYLNSTQTITDTSADTGLGLVSKTDPHAVAPRPLAPSAEEGVSFGLSDDDPVAIQKQLDDAKVKLENCQKQANQGANTGCEARGGTIKPGDNTCRCANGTAVFRIGDKSCKEYLAKTAPNCAAKGGFQAEDDNTCRCPDGTPLFKIGAAANCAEFATQQNPGCAGKGGSIKMGDETCRCPDGTAVFRIGDKTCAEYGGTSTSPSTATDGCKDDRDCDGIVDKADNCSWTEKGAKVWTAGSWAGCAAGQYRDNVLVGPLREGEVRKCNGDADCDGVPDAEDLCSNSPAQANVWTTGEWKGCGQGEARDK